MINVNRMIIYAVSFFILQDMGLAFENTEKRKGGEFQQWRLCRQKKNEALLPIKAGINELKAKIRNQRKKELRATEQYQALTNELKNLKKQKVKLSARKEKRQEIKAQIRELKLTQKDSPEIAELKNELNQLKVSMKKAAGEVDCGKLKKNDGDIKNPNNK